MNCFRVCLGLLVLIVCAEGATIGSTCTKSHDCGTGSCCRDSNSHVLSTQYGGMLANPFGMGHHTGTCSSTKAQKGEMCDSSCQCDTGLSCYRPMSGMCCPASTCMDESYVKKQQAYWSKCLSDPNCAIPA